MPCCNHNAHYTARILRSLPGRPAMVLDVGCGEGGLLTELAERSGAAVGIERDAGAAERAVRRVPTGVRVIHDDFLEHDFGDLTFEAITAVASVHHMPFADALEKMGALLRPGGTLVVLGLYRSETLVDRLADVVAVPANAVLSLARSSPPVRAPSLDPTMSLGEIRSAAAATLPGAHVRRLLLWRYLLTWTKPVITVRWQ